MKPRKNYRSRPKKTGAKKRQKILSQKKRLIAAGCEKERLDKMNSVEIRDLLKETAKRKGPKEKAKPKKVKAKTKKVRVKTK